MRSRDILSLGASLCLLLLSACGGAAGPGASAEPAVEMVITQEPEFTYLSDRPVVNPGRLGDVTLTPGERPLSGKGIVWTGVEQLLFNGDRRQNLTQLEAVGIHLVLDPSQPTELMQTLLDEEGNPNPVLESLILRADTVTIRGRLHLPGTQVEIHAHTLVFEDGQETAQLDTTPLPWSTDALYEGTEIPYRGDGTEGQDGGAISLRILELEAPGEAIRFRSHGGPGQRGAPGDPGSDGQDISNLSFLKTTWINGKAIRKRYPYRENKLYKGLPVMRWHRFAENNPSSVPRWRTVVQGYAGKAPKDAGSGGDGGLIFCPEPLQDRVRALSSLEPGEAAAVQPDLPSPKIGALSEFYVREKNGRLVHLKVEPHPVLKAPESFAEEGFAGSVERLPTRHSGWLSAAYVGKCRLICAIFPLPRIMKDPAITVPGYWWGLNSCPREMSRRCWPIMRT